MTFAKRLTIGRVTPRRNKPNPLMIYAVLLSVSQMLALVVLLKVVQVYHSHIADGKTEAGGADLV